MSTLADVFDFCYAIFQLKLYLQGGFVVTLWQIFVYLLVATVILGIIYIIFN